MARNGSGDFSLLSTFATAGEEPTATAHNAIMDDIADGLSDSVNKDGTKAFAADQSMGGFKLTNVGGATARTGAANLSQVQDGNANWAIAGGTVDAITVTLSPAADALHQGMEVKFRASGANTITAPTLNVNGLGALIIYKNGEQPLVAGDIYGDGHECTVRLNITDTPDRWELLNPRYPSAAVTAATTTEALTGTDTAKFVTADALAALWEKGSDTASATTVSVAEGGYLHITGTTTITDIDFATAKDGRAVTVQFDGILTLTHNATTLVLPGGANITTAAGDTAAFVQDSSDNIKCLWYTRAASSPFAPDVIIEENQTSGTNGGTFTSGADRTRVLNTLVRNVGTVASLASNQFTLPIGTWFIEWEAPAYLCDNHQSFLYNVTGTAEIKRGSSMRAGSGAGVVSVSRGAAVVTIAASTAFEIRHVCQTTASTTGLGIAGSFGTEVYTRVRCWRMA